MLTSLAGMLGHYRKGNVRLRQGLVFGAFGVLGSRLSAAVPGHVLLTAFGVLMIGVGIVMLRQRAKEGRSGTEASPDVTSSADPARRRPALLGGGTVDGVQLDPRSRTFEGVARHL